MKAIAKLLLPLLFVSFNSSAIIIRHDKNGESYNVKHEQYPSVINLDFLMGTLIAPQWIMTAAHGTPLMPGGQKIEMNGQIYRVERIIVHPDYTPETKTPEEQQDYDIALLKLDRAVKGIEPTGIYRQIDEALKNVWFVGEGYTGNGLEGITGAAMGLKHAENTVEKTDAKWLYFNFDAPEMNALQMEGISGPGDSGGPAFIETENGLLVAGVSSHQLDNEAGESMVYGVTERYSRVSSYADWISKTMAKSSPQLHQVALNRPVYEEQIASQKEKQELLGQYDVAGFPAFIIEECGQNICYRWEGQPRTTAIQKNKQDLWFTPSLNRTIQVYRNGDDEIEKLLFKGYQGGNYAIKQKS